MLTKTYFRRKLAQACGLGLVLCAAAACAPQQNVLTKEAIADGWQLLFDGKTLESKKVPGLFCAGELLDVDGGCGGFNLQWAWASGLLAGESAAKSI